METKQPKWKLLANLGDADPIDYGGYFVYIDETGVYPPEGERLEVIDEDKPTWEILRFSLDQCKLVTDKDGHTWLVSFNYNETWPHPVAAYHEWFAEDLARVASYTGQPVEELRAQFCSDGPLIRARAYEAIGDYHGFDNLDSYPLIYSNRADVEARYSADGPRMTVGR